MISHARVVAAVIERAASATHTKVSTGTKVH
jgi:hypothetical protein